MFLWCMVSVLIECGLPDQGLCEVETSARGKVLKTDQEYHLMDFSEYAKKQGYTNLKNTIYIEKYKCTE